MNFIGFSLKDVFGKQKKIRLDRTSIFVNVLLNISYTQTVVITLPVVLKGHFWQKFLWMEEKYCLAFLSGH